jgi:hypothetical protein
MQESCSFANLNQIRAMSIRVARVGGLPREEVLDMCDCSLHSARTRPAKVGEKLVTHNFGTGTRGFAAPEKKLNVAPR